jgi:hypothetical protein
MSTVLGGELTPIDEGERGIRWSPLSNHGHVLVCIASNPDSRIRDIADRVGITERAVVGIIDDLCREEVLTRFKTGRRNRYSIDGDRPLHHRTMGPYRIKDMLTMFENASHL